MVETSSGILQSGKAKQWGVITQKNTFIPFPIKFSQPPLNVLLTIQGYESGRDPAAYLDSNATSLKISWGYGTQVFYAVIGI